MGCHKLIDIDSPEILELAAQREALRTGGAAEDAVREKENLAAATMARMDQAFQNGLQRLLTAKERVVEREQDMESQQRAHFKALYFMLFVALLAQLMLPKESIKLPEIAGMLLGFGGVAVIFSEDLNALGGAAVMTAAMVMMIGLRSISLKTATAPSRGPSSPEEASAVSKSCSPASPGVFLTRKTSRIQKIPSAIAGTKNTQISPILLRIV